MCVTGNAEVQTGVYQLPQVTCKYVSCPVVPDGNECSPYHKLEDSFEISALNTCFTNTNITLDATYPHFRFNRTSEEHEVVTVFIQDLTMHTFTNDTCLEFPSLQSLHITEVRLEVILPNALQSCYLLTTFTAIRNKLMKISSGTFANNPQLERLKLNQNNINIIELNAFDNIDNLLTLFLEQNQIQKFLDVELSYMKKLNYLGLVSQHLKEVNVEEIFTKMPNLKFIYICEDSLVNYKDILQQFESRKVRIVCPKRLLLGEYQVKV